ncbi:MAG: chloride channel protein [Bacteroidetes bacterium GWF2_43_63]|nr:MAG: chloride channel protein [Bacteroidetes bacterium GWE2_42_42]OFY53520.1 MAG: chloride channel protein [Bacteroidetes bacterium GWF2_43_63]HBG71155.1 chloride channel protein [Bacteroidales bacterium]HCB63733.1 chloride channel protein [Bacteroidales bacterium]HCY24482.1 chloride channel protein [Bacteroidales bacterium]
MLLDDYMTRKPALFLRKLIRHKQFVLLLSIVVGLTAGLAAVILKTSVHYIEAYVREQANVDAENFYYLILPGLGILITVLFTVYLIKDDISHGVSKILKALSKGESKMKPHFMYSGLIGCSITSGMGGSVGMEAPILATGAAMGSNIGLWFGQSHKTRMLLIGAGTAGALAAIFKAPIAGVIFAIEVLALEVTAASIIPLLISAVTGALVSTFMLGKSIEFYFSIQEPFEFRNTLYYVILGIVCGLVSVYFLRTNSWIEQSVQKIKKKFWRIILGGGAVGLLIFLFPPLYGEGYAAMRMILSGNIHDLSNNSFFYNFDADSWMFVGYLGLILILKVAAMSLTTGAGGIGGAFAPSLFMGGITGAAFVKVVNLLGFTTLIQSNFILVGMAGLIAGVISAPLTAIFLIAEITGGYALFIPLIVTSSIAYITTRLWEPYSIYTRGLALSGELVTHDRDKSALTLLRVNEVVESDFKTVHPDQTLRELVDVISKSKRNLFPVVDEYFNYLGVITLDSVRQLMFEQTKYDTVYLRDLMQIAKDSVSLNDNLETAMVKFRKTGWYNLPVLNGEKYVGFVSRANILMTYRNKIREFSAE